MPSGPTQRSLAHVREQGYTAEVVERWNPFARVRHDLFGIIDILAIGNGHTLAVQTTSKGNMAARIRKIEESEHLPEIIRSGWRLHVHGWAKDKSGRWQVKVFEVN
jgi:hypothetical protein